MSATPPDLGHFVKRCRQRSYEQGMARLNYAYGVDVRRSHWLASSSIGNTSVRAVDRLWPTLASQLEAETVRSDGERFPLDLLREIAEVMRLLRAPEPTLRILRKEGATNSLLWPAITPLGSTRGASWLVLDIEALQALDAPLRRFAIGSGLGHLQCEHAVFFTAHLLAATHKGGMSVRLLKRLLDPWSRVMPFSADRAGMLAVGSLEVALAGLEAAKLQYDEGASGDWLPRRPPFEERRRALEDFARSAVFARVSLARDRDDFSLLNPTDDRNSPSTEGVADDAWSLARCDERLTRRLRLL